MIVIIGDSWGRGEWRGCEITHGGLGQYLVDAGRPVTNLSRGNGQNDEAMHDLEDYLAHNTTPDAVIWFVTCPLRTSLHRIYDNPIDWAHRQLITAFGYLDQMALRYQTQIYVIGGLCDIPPEIVQQPYDRVTVIIDSVSAMLISNFPRTVFGDVKELHRIKSTEQALDIAHQIEQKYNQYDQSDFFPDGGHPNQQAHQMIFEKIRPYV